uniref:TOG domain-containing protein n=1 Tax=Angiostrongylus cantonensis TaxID=6313 RepID=A0A0K0D7F0_ANGCA
MPKLVNPYLSSFLEMCIECVLNVEKDEAYRHSATEVLATICERSTAVLKKRYSQSIFFILKAVLLLMTELTMDLSDWLAVDDVDADDDEDTVAIGESALDRIACVLGGKYILSSFVALTGKLRRSEEWQERHVAVMGFSVIGEGCQRVMEPQIDQIVREILPFLDDKHPRVRYAACNALGQMSSDFAPTLQKRCHELVVPALMTTILDVSCDRVSAHAAAALINFCEDCPKQIISAYLPAIINGLEQALGNAYGCLQSVGKKLRCEQIVTAIASVADAAQDLFVEFYDRLVPNLKYILLNSTADKYRILRGKTLESLSLIGVAVGKEKFHNDAIAIMDLMRDSMTSVATDHPEYSYLVLGKEFSPYLPMIMGHILQSAAYKPEVAVVEG